MASGLLHATFALIRLGFPLAPELLSLSLAAHRNSQAYSTKDTPLPLRAVTSCQSVVSGSISLPSTGFFSPFPHGTCALSVDTKVFSLGSWSTRLPTGFLVPRRTQVPHHRVRSISRTRISRSLSDFPKSFRYKEVLSLTLRVIPMRPYNPALCGLGSSAFARRYLRNLF